MAQGVRRLTACVELREKSDEEENPQARAIDVSDGARERAIMPSAFSRRRRFTNSAGVEILPGEHILELKYHTHVPLLFKRLIEEFQLAPQPISKYRLSAQVLDFTRDKEGLACLSF